MTKNKKNLNILPPEKNEDELDIPLTVKEEINVSSVTTSQFDR